MVALGRFQSFRSPVAKGRIRLGFQHFSQKCICVSLASSLTHKVSSRSELDAAADLVLDLDQPLEDIEWLAVLFAVEGGQHPRVIVDGGHSRPQTLPERRSLRPPTQVVVALRARRLGDDLQLARLGIELECKKCDECA